MSTTYDALLILSFGGPESREEVIPFLENVLRGKDVPRERMLEVAEHYYHFDGKSPINAQNRELVAALKKEFAAKGPDLPIYWGNRNWHPLLADTLRQMQKDGVRRALGFVSSAYSSYSSCRQYLDDVARAREQVGPGAPEVDKLRVFYNHPGFIEPMIENVGKALAQFSEDVRREVPIVFTAHSVPLSMAETSRYVEQLEEACGLVAAGVGRSRGTLVYQSRSGPPSQPWLEPDICDHLRQLQATGIRNVVVMPIGFVSDHMEVLYDLDTEAQDLCRELGIRMVRASAAGSHPKFVAMIRELVLERLEENRERRFLGELGLRPDVCAADCCPRPQQPGVMQPGRPATRSYMTGLTRK
ncbi:MAG: ferrochelatase [Acidobacteria bacterium]|nr:ferrochelatase [Acidobacteriota bacterium]